MHFYFYRSLIMVVFVLCLTALLTSCATMPFSQNPLNQSISWAKRSYQLSKIQQWNMQGAIAIRTPQKTLSANLNWQQIKKEYQIILFGPFGIGTTIMNGSPTSFTLQTSDKKILTAHSPEQLIYQQMGWQLPVHHLYYWIRGLPVPYLKASIQFDPYHHIHVLKQAKWQINYLSYSSVNGMDFPKRISLQNSFMKLYLVIINWNVLIAQ